MKTCIVVLGMHRSGTSAITGALEKMGVVLPQELMPPTEDNPKGYFEGLRVMQINDAALSDLQSNWDDTRFSLFITDQLIEKYLPEVKRFIQEEFFYSKVFALKDPRMCITFPLWERALLELGIEIKVVIPYRNPFEVARSLKKRNDFSTEKSLLLWAKHLLFAEKYSRKYSRFFIGFDQLIAKTAYVLPKLSEFVGVELSQEAMASVKDEFLEPSLKHYNLNIRNVSENIPIFIQRLIALSKNEGIKKITEEEWDEVFNEVSAIYQFLHTYDVQFQSQISRDLHAQRDQANAQAKHFEEQLSQQTEQSQAQLLALEAEKATLVEREGALNQELDRLVQDLESIKAAKQAQKDELQSQVDRLSTEKATLDEEAQRLQQQLSEQAQDHDQALEDKDQQLHAVQERLSGLEQRHAEQTEQSQAQLLALEAEKAALVEREGALNQELDRLVQDLERVKEAKQAQKDELQSQVDSLSTEKATLHEAMHQLQEQLSEQAQASDQALQDKDQQLHAVQEQLSDLERRHGQQTEQHQAQLSALEAENLTLLEKRDQLLQEIEELKESIDTVVQDLDLLKQNKRRSHTASIFSFANVFKR
ncbi:hypothetical protein [Vreelandella aquamarina]|uniref:hypothetical protein n=1 Tax=Vreelandella aquamarina TaxID=77097 RepID=UPI001D1925A0|nr:hypothetical protein [Halomonas meridiana]MCC4288862.1 hypothetical protein [Halomonas meridiana]